MFIIVAGNETAEIMLWFHHSIHELSSLNFYTINSILLRWGYRFPLSKKVVETSALLQVLDLLTNFKSMQQKPKFEILIQKF